MAEPTAESLTIEEIDRPLAEIGPDEIGIYQIEDDDRMAGPLQQFLKLVGVGPVVLRARELEDVKRQVEKGLINQLKPSIAVVDLSLMGDHEGGVHVAKLLDELRSESPDFPIKHIVGFTSQEGINYGDSVILKGNNDQLADKLLELKGKLRISGS